MARPDFPRTIMEFQERFPDDVAYLEYLAASRWPEGYRWPGLRQRACLDLGASPSSVTAGTVMHGTRTPLRLWFWAAYLVATHTPGISAQQLQRQLGLSRYETAWLVLQKLRRAMVAPEREPLRGKVEVDEGFVGGVNPDRKAGRGPVGKRLVGVAVEVRGAGSGRLRLAGLADASKRPLGARGAENVESGAIVHTDGWGGYADLSARGFDHRPISQRWRSEERRLILPRAHRALSNVKTWLQGTHRSASEKHLQAYLDEFVFRHNRRRTPMAAFQTLLGLAAAHEPSTYAEITSRTAA